MKIVFNRGNAYFDTYYIYDDSHKQIGTFEHHCRGVKKEYFVGWKLNHDSLNTGMTESFGTKEEAILYSLSGL